MQTKIVKLVNNLGTRRVFSAQPICARTIIVPSVEVYTPTAMGFAEFAIQLPNRKTFKDNYAFEKVIIDKIEATITWSYLKEKKSQNGGFGFDKSEVAMLDFSRVNSIKKSDHLWIVQIAYKGL